MATDLKRRRLPAAQRRRLILDAALDVVGRKGFQAASIDEIATAAGVSKALIYEHFASKQALREALLSDHVEELFRRLAANAERGGTGADRLRGGLDAFLGFVAERRAAWLVLFRDATDPDMAATLARVQDQAAGVIAALMSAEPDAPADELTLRAYAQLLVGALQSLAAWWVEHPEVERTWVLDRAMDFCWLGMERVRSGEASGPSR